MARARNGVNDSNITQIKKNDLSDADAKSLQDDEWARRDL
jgi:hypothetical protein